MKNEEFICRKVAQLFTGRNWHKLTIKEREIVSDLSQAGFIEIKEVPNGFIGKVK